MTWLKIGRAGLTLLCIGVGGVAAGEQRPAAAPQAFDQEIVRSFGTAEGLASGEIQVLDLNPDGVVRVLTGGRWYGWRIDGAWRELEGWAADGEGEVVVADSADHPVRVPLPWRALLQIERREGRVWLVTEADPFELVEGAPKSLGWPSRYRVRQVAADAEGQLWVASSGGLYRQAPGGWAAVGITDGRGRAWAVEDVLGVVFDDRQRLWVATRAGVICRDESGWRFYEGRDGLPWNEFTSLAAGVDGAVWFGTKRGAIRWDATGWHYRQGPRWLRNDEVRSVEVDGTGAAWFGTAGGLGRLAFEPMTLAQKADHYETEIERYVKRTPFGFVAEAALRRPGDRTSGDPQDSDNDGLWTAMYGAGECFSYGATGDSKALERARQVFESLRFLQKVTQGGEHAPPKGYVARTVRPVDWPDPNVGRLERDRAEQRGDRLWKVYEPRWPKSADGQWYWKSDTSSDELDGHFFFYPLYFDLCATTMEEKERVREVVRDLTDHILENGYVLMEYDGRPTRWAVFSPTALNRDPDWWPERGLNSLSMLAYLAVAQHVTGDPKYAVASRELIERHGYAQNAMYPKLQQGPGSGNQSDDEMAFMCFYTLLRCSTDEELKAQIRWSFYRYWANEAAELNPFFNFAYAAHSLGSTGDNPWGTFPLDPWGNWLEESLATLRGFPLDRLNWPHQNSHRLDLVWLRPPAVRDLYETDQRRRGYRVNGRVLPVENRHFNHWNTDPWQLDYGGGGDELAAGTVFLLPYYLGLYHGFIAKPTTE